MNKIELYEQWIDIVNKFKKEYKKFRTNMFFMPDEIKQIMAIKQVFYLRMEAVLLFFIEEEECIRVYYFVDKDHMADIRLPLLNIADKSMVLDLVMREPENNVEIAWWKTEGYIEYKTYIRMQTGMKRDNNIEEEVLLNEDTKLECADVRQCNRILELWKTHLDKYSISLPKQDEMKRILKTGHVYCVKSIDEIIGVVYIDSSKKRCMLRHLVIDKKYRKLGYGTKLMDFALKRVALEGIESCYLWVDVDNIPANFMYEKYGFRKDSLIMKQLIHD